VLAANAGNPVTVDALVYELWSDDAPRSFMTTLQTHILLIRKSNTVKISLMPDRRSYCMEVDASNVDLLLYIQNQKLAQRHIAEGKFVEAERLLNVNAGLEIGPLFGGIPRGEIMNQWVKRYGEFQWATAENRFEALLRQGRHQEILVELSVACGRRPFDEVLFTKLMLALYRCGRRLDVLAAYNRFNCAVRDELGLEPSIWVKRLHQCVLADDEELLKLSFRPEV
jgi:DNA-binding SARP family transcriptional activator